MLCVYMHILTWVSLCVCVPVYVQREGERDKNCFVAMKAKSRLACIKTHM